MAGTFAATGGYRLKLVGVRPIGSTANHADFSRLRAPSSRFSTWPAGKA